MKRLISISKSAIMYNDCIFIPLGMIRSVEHDNDTYIQHPVRMHPYRMPKSCFIGFSTKRCIPNGIRIQRLKNSM